MFRQIIQKKKNNSRLAAVRVLISVACIGWIPMFAMISVFANAHGMDAAARDRSRTRAVEQQLAWYDILNRGLNAKKTLALKERAAFDGTVYARDGMELELKRKLAILAAGTIPTQIESYCDFNQATIAKSALQVSELLGKLRVGYDLPGRVEDPLLGDLNSLNEQVKEMYLDNCITPEGVADSTSPAVLGDIEKYKAIHERLSRALVTVEERNASEELIKAAE